MAQCASLVAPYELHRAARVGDSTTMATGKAAHLSATSLLRSGDYRAHFVLPPPWIPAAPSESPSTLKPPSTLGELMPSSPPFPQPLLPLPHVPPAPETCFSSIS